MSAKKYGLEPAGDPEVPRPQMPPQQQKQQQMSPQMQQQMRMQHMMQNPQMAQQMMASNPGMMAQMQQQMAANPQMAQMMQNPQMMQQMMQQQMMMQQNPQMAQQMAHQQMMAQQQRAQQQMSPEQRRAQKIKYQTIYPQYIDQNFLPSEGRKLPKNQCCDGPSADEVIGALKEMGFTGMYKDHRKSLPCSQSSAVMYPPAYGCVKVAILEPRKSEDPKEEEERVPIHAEYPTRGAVLKKVAAILKGKAQAERKVQEGPDRSGKGNKRKAQLEEAQAFKAAAKAVTKKGGKRK